MFGPASEHPAEDPDARPAWAFRFGDLIDVNAPLYADAAGHPRGPAEFGDIDTGSTSLYRDGTLLATVPTPGRGAFRGAPLEAADYRLSHRVLGGISRGGRSPTSVAARLDVPFGRPWTAALCGSPLLAVRFEPALDLANRAPAGRGRSRIPIPGGAAGRFRHGRGDRAGPWTSPTTTAGPGRPLR